MEKKKGYGTRAHKNSKQKMHLFFAKPAFLLCLADSLLARYVRKLQAQLEFSQFSEQTSWHQNLSRLPTACIFKSLMILSLLSPSQSFDSMHFYTTILLNYSQFNS